jgi:acetylornithine/N-succinyldiaminopimelate aminotransferase
MSTASADWTERYQGALMNTFGSPQLVLARGKGAHVWDVDGKEYVDLYAGIAVNALGHGHPRLVAAVHQQLQTLGHVSNFFASTPQIELAERLLALLLPSGSPLRSDLPGRVFFTNSGTEANEAGLKLTRRTGRTHLVAALGSFHGRTMGALSLTSKESYRAPFEPLPGDVTFVTYGDADALAAAVTDKTAAVILEPVQGEAGVIIPPRGYLAAAREITRAHGALLWLDEVQTGMGRTGTWLAHQNELLCDAVGTPDILTLAKGLAGGIPIGACLATGAAAELLQPGHHGTTFGGNPVAAAAALAVIDVIESEGLLAEAVRIGRSLVAAVTGPGVSSVRVIGSFVGVDLESGVAAPVVAAAREAGFLINNTSPNTLRLAPPLILEPQDVASFARTWPEILAETTAEGRTTA